MQDDLNFVLGNLGSLFLVCNVASTQLDEMWKTTPLKFWIWRLPYFWENGRGPQFFENGRSPHFYKLYYNFSSKEIQPQNTCE
jgi:hypothetical protein